MSSGERPIGAAKGKQPDTEALCHPPPPPGHWKYRPAYLFSLYAPSPHHPSTTASIATPHASSWPGHWCVAVAPPVTRPIPELALMPPCDLHSTLKPPPSSTNLGSGGTCACNHCSRGLYSFAVPFSRHVNSYHLYVNILVASSRTMALPSGW